MRLEKEERIEQEKSNVDHELELAKILSSSQFQSFVILNSNESNAMKGKFISPKLEFRSFGSEIKDLLAFCS